MNSCCQWCINLRTEAQQCRHGASGTRTWMQELRLQVLEAQQRRSRHGRHKAQQRRTLLIREPGHRLRKHGPLVADYIDLSCEPSQGKHLGQGLGAGTVGGPDTSASGSRSTGCQGVWLAVRQHPSGLGTNKRAFQKLRTSGWSSW